MSIFSTPSSAGSRYSKYTSFGGGLVWRALKRPRNLHYRYCTWALSKDLNFIPLGKPAGWRHARVRGAPLRSRTVRPRSPGCSGREVTSLSNTCIAGIFEKKNGKRARLALKQQKRAAMIGRDSGMQVRQPPGACLLGNLATRSKVHHSLYAFYWDAPGGYFQFSTSVLTSACLLFALCGRSRVPSIVWAPSSWVALIRSIRYPEM